MKVRKKLAKAVITTGLSIGLPVVAFGQIPPPEPPPPQPFDGCDECGALSTISGYLSQIASDISAIKDTLVDTSDDAGASYGYFISSLSAMKSDRYLKDLNNTTNEKSNAMSNDYQEGEIGSAYGAYKQETYGNYSSLNATSLFGNNLYTSDQEKAAERYMGLLAGSALPGALPESTSDDGGKKKMNKYNTIAAVQSLNSYNVSTIYSARSRVNTPSSLDSVLSSPQSSRGELLDYIYRGMVLDDAWLTGIAGDTPIDLSRKTVYLLVGAFTALYRMEKNQQQMLATMTAANTLTIANIQAMEEMSQKMGADKSDEEIVGEYEGNSGQEEEDPRDAQYESENNDTEGDGE